MRCPARVLVPLLLLGAASCVWAADAVCPDGVKPQVSASQPAEPEALDRGDPPKPGHETPVAGVKPCSIRFDWDTYRTLVVVGEGIGIVRPAWVATFEEGKFIVGYRATAFRDARGRLHIDARLARDVGPNANNWIPDSFAFGYKLLWTLDDQGSGHVGAMGQIVTAATDHAAWNKALQEVQALIEGGL